MKPNQLEIQWDEPESFALVPQTALDGDWVTAEKVQSIADQQHAKNQQEKLNVQ